MWLLLVLALLAVLGPRVTEGRVEPLPSLPPELDNAFATFHQIGDLTEQSGEMVFWSAIQHYMSKFAKSRPTMSGQEFDFLRENVNEFMEPLFESVPGSEVKRQAPQAQRLGACRPRPGARLRREIRMLSRRDRGRYFEAVNALKNDTRLTPNVYDVIADFHTGDNIAVAHFGPNFPSWHRLYLWLFESFLRLHVPTVTVPFWASVLDNEMVDSTSTVLFTAAFLGNGIGEPRIGPFRNWRSINPATVFTRNIGNGPLYTYEGIEAIVNRTRNRDILLPTAHANSNFEMQHGGPYVWCGGTMNRLDRAAFDPIFFLHHSFVDQIWERFRFNQIANGVDPGTDYHFIEGDLRFRPQHRPNATMGFFPNKEFNIDYVNVMGYSNIFFQLVQYDLVPRCPACGGSRYLRCNRATNRCRSRSEAEMRGRDMEPIGPGTRIKRQAVPDIDTCPKRSFINDYDYKRLWNSPQVPPGPAPHSDWVYIPCKIVSKRTDDYKSFNYYSLHGMSESAHYGMKNTFLKRPTHYAYSTCSRHHNIASKIKIVSYGLSYEGYAEEYALTDNRIGVSVSYGFVPVKRPTGGASDVFIGAFDSCGRACKPYCRSGGSADMEFAGAFRVTNELPYQYDNSYAEATLNAWEVPSASACPTLNYENMPLSFFCEYTDSWIWSKGSTEPEVRDMRPPTNPWPRRGVLMPNMVAPGTGMSRGLQVQTDGRSRSHDGRSGRRRGPSSRGVGAPFHGAGSSPHSTVQDALGNWSHNTGTGIQGELRPFPSTYVVFRIIIIYAYKRI